MIFFILEPASLLGACKQARLAGLPGFYNRNRALLVSCPSMFVFSSLIGKGLPLRFSTSSFSASIIGSRTLGHLDHDKRAFAYEVLSSCVSLVVLCFVMSSLMLQIVLSWDFPIFVQIPLNTFHFFRIKLLFSLPHFLLYLFVLVIRFQISQGNADRCR